MARPVTAARRYAEAAFEVALRDDSLERWRDDLDLAAETMAEPNVARAVENPAVALTQRRDLVGKLLAKRLAEPSMRLVDLLVSRRRAELLPRVAEEYRRLLGRHQGIMPAVVTSAVELTKAEATAIRERVEAMAGSKVDLRTEVDPAIIGGLTIQVGDRLLDDSVRGRLEQLRVQLRSGARPR
jgi:F-type H+-transporting ATPase subunit delta